MERSHRPTSTRRNVCAALLSAYLSIVQQAIAADDSGEQARLAAVVRQIDLLDRLAKQSAATVPQERARYHFDYVRFTADLQRMRSGIHDYLAPRRAQPRDAAALLGDYRKDSEPEAEGDQ